MKKRLLFFSTIISLSLGLNACSGDDTAVDTTDDQGIEIPVVPEEATALNLESYKNGSGVMMQTFYWDVEPRHEWWKIINEKVEGWANAGVDRIWLPAVSKGKSGGYSMGYDPSDYFDFGEFMQHGTIPTRFGTRSELETLIANAHNNDLEVIADIILNHNSGGGKEFNPYRGYETYTRFDEDHGNASGMFNRNYNHFHPNDIHERDEGDLFFDEQDLCHHQEYVQKWLWKDENSVAKYYKNTMKFDGWRFDYVKGFGPWVIKEWMESVGGFAVGENWDGDAAVLEKWVEETGVSAFDFAAFYKLEEALDRHNDLTYLGRDMLRKTYPDQAVTFVANHDTEKDTNEDNRISSSNKMKAYAYILTHDGYPTIFYSDYENEAFQDDLKQLILIHNSLATGDVEVLYNDDDEYVMKRSGNASNPGLILYINTSGNTKRRSVVTNWTSKKLMDYSFQSSHSPETGGDGTVSIEAPGNSYSVWSIME
ncbi:MAG: alpha-amylase [Bacteroidota bacterium]